MKTEIRRINRLTKTIERALFYRDSTLDYWRTVEAIAILADACHDYDGETEDWLYLNESGMATPDAIIIGAHWHGAEWHGGQSCPVYAMTCATGSVYSPGMESGPQEESSENDVYLALAEMAEKEHAPAA